MKKPLTIVLLTLCAGFYSGHGLAATCSDVAYDGDYDKQEAKCAQKAMTTSKSFFGDAIRAKEKGDVQDMCNSLDAALGFLEPYRKGSWRNNSDYRQIAEGVSSNYSTIQDSFLETNCPNKVRYFKDKAAKGDAWAIRNLGLLYSEGKLVPQDHAAAMRYAKEAADKGSIGALIDIGWMHDKGLGVPQSDSEAFSWYMKAAQNESATAAYNVGMMYRKGRGVTQDFEEAAKWLRLAKKHGDEDAEEILDEMYKAGQAKKPFFSFF